MVISIRKSTPHGAETMWIPRVHEGPRIPWEAVGTIPARMTLRKRPTEAAHSTYPYVCLPQWRSIALHVALTLPRRNGEMAPIPQSDESKIESYHFTITL